MKRKEKNINDVLYILNNLRIEDKHECLIQKGENYVNDLADEIMKRNDYMVMGVKKSDETPVCIGGICKTQNINEGVVWLLATDEIVKYQHCLLRNLKQEILNFDKNYWITYNKIYNENFLAKKWLKKFGYKFFPSESKDFEYFIRIRKRRGLGE